MPDTISCAVAESNLHDLMTYSTYKIMMQLLCGLDVDDFNFVHHSTIYNSGLLPGSVTMYKLMYRWQINNILRDYREHCHVIQQKYKYQ